MENLSRVFQKQTKKKTHKEIEFHNSIQDWEIEFLPLFTGSRKVLGKMSAFRSIYIYLFFANFQYNMSGNSININN